MYSKYKLLKISGKIAINLLLSTSFSLTLNAQGLKMAIPESEGMSSTHIKRIDSLFTAFTKDHKVAGITAVVTRHGSMIYYGASGYRDIAANQLMQKTDIFRFASQTKAITTVAIMMLYEEGKLLLDDPISKYIPEFRNSVVLKTFNEKDSTYTTEPAKREITIHDLLTHTSGIGYAAIGTKPMTAIYKKTSISMGFEPRHVVLADKMKALAKLPLAQQPGTGYLYGLNMDVLGYIIEIVTGKSLNDFFEERIFNPLGMKDTYFYVPANKQYRIVKVYTDKNGVVENKSSDSTGVNVIYPFTKNGTYYSGGAGLSSTAYDFSLFLQMLDNKGELNGKRLLSPNSVRLMTTNQIADMTYGLVGNKEGFCFEVVTEKGEQAAPWHAGTFAGGGFWGTNYWVDPKEDLVVQLCTQHVNFFEWPDMLAKFKAIIYGSILN
jgi:CubicO group peptidase (beta-lactamase class C family)